MPLAWFLGLVALVGMATVGLGFLVDGIWWGRIFDLFLGLFCIPFVLVVLRFLRGHYNKDLSEP